MQFTQGRLMPWDMGDLESGELHELLEALKQQQQALAKHRSDAKRGRR